MKSSFLTGRDSKKSVNILNKGTPMRTWLKEMNNISSTSYKVDSRYPWKTKSALGMTVEIVC